MGTNFFIRASWDFAQLYYVEEEDPHDFTHPARMEEDLLAFQVESSSRADGLSKEQMDAIRIAIHWHDAGIKAGRENHADVSVGILRDLVRENKLAIPNLGWVLYAISRHSKGVKMSKNPTSGQICAAMLILFDYLDAIGSIGIYRHYRFCPDKTLLPDPGNYDWEKFNKKMYEFLINPDGVDVHKRESLEFKDSSILGGLAFIYALGVEVMRTADPFISGSETERNCIALRALFFDNVTTLWKTVKKTI